MSEEPQQYNFDPKFPEPVSFSYEIELYLKRNKCSGYVEAIIKYCNEYSIDIEDIVPLVTSTLKSKLEGEAAEYGVLLTNISQPIMCFE